MFRFENIKADSKQLEFLTSLSRETWDCVWYCLEVQSSKDILSAKSAATEDQERKIEPGSSHECTLSFGGSASSNADAWMSIRSGQFVVCVRTS